MPCLAVLEISITHYCVSYACASGAANIKFCGPVQLLLWKNNGPSGVSDLIYDTEDVDLELDQSVQTLNVLLWPWESPNLAYHQPYIIQSRNQIKS